MTASIGGAAFNSHTCYESSSAGDPYYRVTASIGDSLFIGITIYSPDGYLHLATYPLGASDSMSHAGYTIGGDVAGAVSGSVTLTSINTGNDFTGTFSFTCVNGTVVNAGEFTAVF